jgi:hypothetical protein
MGEPTRESKLEPLLLNLACLSALTGVGEATEKTVSMKKARTNSTLEYMFEGCRRNGLQLMT